MEKRLILAIAFSILIIVSFQYFFVKPAPQRSAEKISAQAPPQATPIKESQPAPALMAEPASNEKELNVETDKYILTFSNIGGSIKNIKLKDYDATGTKEPMELANIKDPRRYIFAISDPTSVTTLNLSAYEMQKNEDVITYTLRLENLEITKRFILRNNKYIIELQLNIRNISASGKNLAYRIIGGAGLTEHDIQDRRFLEATSKIDGKSLNFKSPKKGQIVNSGLVSWAALKNKYFSVILKPFIKTNNEFYNEAEDGTLVSGVESKEFLIPPNSFIDHKFVLYAGPSQISIMKEFGLEFEEAAGYGFFGGISKALISLMRFLFTLVHNWGVSIILLSIFLNLILSPLTFKSFKSMQKMQALHPQMEKLKAQHKDNPQKVNKEILELYKKYNINPFSGCLPMLLQMPIFIALYNALIRAIELRGVNFLWIKDLSMPDAVNIPFTLPILGNSINILPLFMVGAMVVQQTLSTKSMGGAVTEEQKQQQKMMLIIMPIMFGFIFYNMPSGLVLYWIINTVLTIVEQYMLFKNA